MADPSVLSMGLVDAEGINATQTLFLNIPSTATIANLTTFVAAYAPLLDAIDDGKITYAEVRVKVPLPTGLKANPITLSNVESTGLFNFFQAGSAYKFGIDVPAIGNNKIVNGKINLSDSDVLNWITFMSTATAGITVVSKFLAALGTLIDALRTFRKHRRALNHASFEA